MFESTDTVLRVPAAALAARPHGMEVAARMVDLAEALARAVADPPAEREPDPEVVAEAELVDEIGCWERAKARAEARQLRAMATLARRPMFAGCAEHGHDDPAHGIRGAASVVSPNCTSHPARPGPGSSWRANSPNSCHRSSTRSPPDASTSTRRG